VLPLEGGERKPIEVFRTPKQLLGGLLSPDGRFVAYTLNESGRNGVYVRHRDLGGAGEPWQISPQGGTGVQWRRDCKELSYLAPDQGVMAVDVSTSPLVTFGTPKLLFRPQKGRFSGFNISLDGERIAMREARSQLRQLTIFDRQGKVVKTVGKPGF